MVLPDCGCSLYNNVRRLLKFDTRLLLTRYPNFFLWQAQFLSLCNSSVRLKAVHSRDMLLHIVYWYNAPHPKGHPHIENREILRTCSRSPLATRAHVLCSPFPPLWRCFPCCIVLYIAPTGRLLDLDSSLSSHVADNE